MLQRSRSKNVSKLKFLLLIPAILLMLTYVACSEDKNDVAPQEVSLTEQIANLEAALESKEELTEEEKQQLLNLLKKREQFKLEAESGHSEADKVAFGAMDRVPAFQGCEQLEGDERKNCTVQKISEFIVKNFDNAIGKELGLSGRNRVVVQFRIDETGEITDIKSRASHPELEAEAERVVAEIPQMHPGKQNGKAVSVMYSLPIVFEISE